MRILAIETSCDETAAAVVEGSGDMVRVIANVVGSQIKTHEPYGGVVPELAARRHAELITPVIQEAIEQEGGAVSREHDIDAIAVTEGPGLMVCLLVGVEAAKSIAYAWNKPLIPVNHLAGHLFSTLGTDAVDIGLFKKSHIALIVSGGHTELMLVQGIGSYTLLGKTIDDAAGEAFDKVAKMLGLPYPGGPAISKIALNGREDAYNMPRPMIDSRDWNFSFSGIKTHVEYTLDSLRKDGNLSIKDEVPDIAASFQEAVCDVLVAKTIAAAHFAGVGMATVSGGVAANDRLREKMNEAAQEAGIACYVAPRTITGDNAAMIGIAGYIAYQYEKHDQDFRLLIPNPNLRLAVASAV